MSYKRWLRYLLGMIAYSNIEELWDRGLGEEVLICICDLFIKAIS